MAPTGAAAVTSIFFTATTLTQRMAGAIAVVVIFFTNWVALTCPPPAVAVSFSRATAVAWQSQSQSQSQMVFPEHLHKDLVHKIYCVIS